MSNINNIQNSAAPIAKRIGAYTAYGAKWIVYLGRKYPILAALHIAVTVWFLFFYGRQGNLPIPTTTAPPTPAPVTAPTPAPTPAATTPITPPASAPDPVVQIAQARAFKDGDEITIRWNQAVKNPKLYADNKLLNASCDDKTCVVDGKQKMQQIQAKWQQQGQPFEKAFRF